MIYIAFYDNVPAMLGDQSMSDAAEFDSNEAFLAAWVSVPLLQQILDLSVMRQGEIMGVVNE